MTRVKLLFLDFDGVLHPNFSPRERLFCHVDALMGALQAARECPAVVVSSSWRFQRPVDELLGFLPEPLRDIVVGVTPEVEPGRLQRHREILAYLRSVQGTPDWRALDDERIGFPDDCRELILCNGKTGLGPSAIDCLSAWLCEPAP